MTSALSIAQVATAVSTLISIALLWTLLWLYLDYRVDRFRQEMFGLRDELFDLARAGVIPFDSPLYITVRTILNGFIRFGQRLGLTSIFIGAAHEEELGQLTSSLGMRMEEALNALPSPDRARVASVVTRMHERVILHLVLTSPPVQLVTIGLVLYALLRTAGVSVHRRVKDLMRRLWLDPLDAIALQVGTLTPRAGQ